MLFRSPFLRMAESFKIPWFIFSDGEPATITAVSNALAAIGQNAIPNNPRVFVIPDDNDFEAYIVNGASKDLLIAAIIKHEAKTPQHEEALRADWNGKSQPDQLTKILETLNANKTQYGSRIGKSLPVPAALEDLFKRIDTDLAAPKPKAQTV